MTDTFKELSANFYKKDKEDAYDQGWQNGFIIGSFLGAILATTICIMTSPSVTTSRFIPLRI